MNTTTDVFEAPRVSQRKFDCEVKPGISSFADDPSQLPAQLLPCLHAAEDKLPAGSVKATPVYLRATAGMRVLLDNDPDKAAAVLAEATAAINETLFNTT